MYVFHKAKLTEVMKGEKLSDTYKMKRFGRISFAGA